MIKDEDIYKKILAYYDLSDKIMTEILNNNSISIQVKEDVLIPVATNIKNTTDFLVETYIMFLKMNKNKNFKNIIINTLDKLLFEISICKNKLYSMSRK